MTDTLPDGFEIITDQTPPPERGLVVSGAGQDLPAGFEVITDEPAPTNQRGGVERVVDSLFASAPAIEGVRQAFGQDSELFRLSPEKQVKWLDNQTRKANKKLEKATRAYENLKKRGRPEGGRVSSTTGLSAADRYDAQLAEQLGRARRAKEQLDKVDAVLSGADDAPEFGPIKNAIAGAGKTFLNAFGEAIPKAAGAVEATLTGADPQDTIGFRAGQAFADNTDFALATDSARSADTVQQVAEGLGQAASILVPASRLSAAGRGSVAVGATSAGLGAVQGGAAGLDEAVAFDGTAKQQLISFYANAGLGVTEAIPLNRLLGRLNKTSGGQVERILKTGASQGIEEMAQEIGQTIGSNVIADELAGYDEGRAILEGAGEAGKIGGIIGALLGAGGAAVTRGPQTEPTAPDAQPDAPEQPSDDGAQLEPENPDREPTRRIRANPVKPGKAWTSDGTETAVEYAVVEASDLITSHDPEGNLNPAYPQILQPRDRARKASQTQVSDIANNLTPERLGETPDAGSGAPIISENGVVESGNGRSMGLKQAYAQNPEKAQEYREWLEASGYPTEGMTAPVLVRIGDPSRTDGQRVAFTRAANARATADMSVTERSISDAKELRPQDFDLARTGGVESPANRDFARTLVSRLATEADLGRLIDAKGVLSVDGKRRLDAAIAAYAFEDPRVVSDLLETTDSTLRSIGQSLVEVAPKWASLRAGVEAGTVDPRANILPNIIEAANIVKDAREAGQTVPERIEVLNADFLRDPLSSTTKDVLDVFYDPKTNRQRSPKQIAAELAYFAQEGEKASGGENLFGDDSNPAERIFDRLAVLRASGQNITIDDDFTPSTAKPLHELPEGFEIVPRETDTKADDKTTEFADGILFSETSQVEAPLSTEAFSKKLEKDLGLRSLHLFDSHNGTLSLDMIAVERADQGKGKGSQAMEAIANYADQVGKTVTLTTGVRDDGFGTTSQARLKKFYKRFGFVENKGRNKDFSISGNMYRLPKTGSQPEVLFSETPSRAARKTAQLEYPIAPRGEWYGEANYKDTGGELIEMTPQEYLDRVRPLKMDEESRENIDILKEHIQSGKTLDPLKLFDGGKEDGRHRAHAAKELGIESVPVIAFGDQIPSRQPEPPAGFEVLQDAAPQPKPEPAAPEPPTPAIEPQPAPTNDVEAIKGLHIITADIARRFGVIYKQGRLGRVPKRVQGWYKPKTGALRGRKSYLEDIKTFAHEIGHHWEFSNGPELRTLMDRFASELTPLDYDPNRKDRKLAVSEGFAEYFRQYITHRDFVKKAAPKFTKEYEAWLDREHPGLRQDIQTFTDQYQAYLKAPSSSRVKSNIVRKIKRNGLARMMNRERPDGSKSLKNQLKNEAEDRLIDGYAPFKRLVADLLDLKSANKGKPQDLKAIDDPFALLRLSENSMTAAMADAEFGVKGYNDATPSGPSFKEAVREATNGKPTQENIDDFEAYLISRRAVQEWDRYFKGEIPNEPVLHSKADHEQTIKDMEAKHKQFKSAAKKIYEYQRNLLKKSFDAGHMDRKTYDELLKRKDYVPFKRDMSDRESAQHFQGGANSRQGLGKNASAKHVFRGSGRPIISPLQSIVEETVRVTTNTQQTRITNALIDLAESAGRGSAALVEVVPLEQLTGDRINLADAFKQRLNNSDLNPDEKDALSNDFDTMLDGNEMATVFKMSEIRAKTGETILYGMKDGKQVGLIVNDPDYARTIAEAIGHANNQNANAIVTGLAMTARVFRAGVTTHPVFAAKNVIRDQVGGWLQTDAGVIPFLDGYKGAMSYINRDMMYQAYVSNFGTSAGIEQSTLQDRDLVRSVEEFAAEGITVKKVANLHAFAKLTDASEVASRMGNYMKFYKKFKKQGMTDQEAAVEAAWEATRVIDFSMTGRDVKQVRRMVPFLGSQISGMTRSKQVFFAKGSVKNRKAYWNYLRTGDPKNLSQKDIREIELQRTAWMKAVIGLGIPSLISLALYGDDEDFEKFEGYERRSNWIFRLGDKWVFIPKPFELASAANALERSYESFILNDRKAAKKWLEDTASMFKPPTDNPLINTIYEQRANHNMFFGMPIVGQDIQSLPAPEQANAYTSSLAKQMGQLIGRLPGIGRTGIASPARIDHAIKNATGTWGRDALRLMDTLASQRPATTAETAVVSSGFIKNPDSGARETSALFDKVGMTGQWTGAAKHLKDMLAEGDMKAAGRAMVYAKDEAGKDYAVADRMKDLDIQFRGKKRMTDKEYTALKRQHPMRRAKEASTIIRKARKELMGNKFEVKMTDRERQKFVDKLSQLHNAINANGMIVSEVKGWEHRKLVDEAGKWQDLRAISEKGAKLIWLKTKKKKMTPEAKIVSAYADLKKKTAPYIERLENQK